MKYSITHCCGHTEEHDIIGTNAHGERDRKIAWYETTLCRDCYIKEQTADCEEIEMSYADYKKFFSDCRKKDYNATTKTIIVFVPAGRIEKPEEPKAVETITPEEETTSIETETNTETEKHLKEISQKIDLTTAVEEWVWRTKEQVREAIIDAGSVEEAMNIKSLTFYATYDSKIADIIDVLGDVDGQLYTIIKKYPDNNISFADIKERYLKTLLKTTEEKTLIANRAKRCDKLLKIAEEHGEKQLLNVNHAYANIYNATWAMPDGSLVITQHTEIFNI